MSKLQVAFGKDNQVHLLCAPWKLDSKGEVYHFVRNGHWHYRPEIDTHLKLEEVWRGTVPEEYDSHYNDAIDWINSQLAKEPRLV